MPKYVYSLRASVSRVHLLRYDGVAECYAVFAANYETADDLPPLHVCPRCVDRAVARGVIDAFQAVRLTQHVPVVSRDTTTTPNRATRDERIGSVIALLTEGLTDKQVAIRLGIGLRTLVRDVSAAMYEAGVETRFQWAYLLGRASTRD